MIRFVWSRLVHTPLPSSLVYIESYSRDYLINPDFDFGPVASIESDIVPMLVFAPFDIHLFSSTFSYKGRTIATPFLSTSGLEDPANDRRLLGNCVYWAGSGRLNPWSFRDFFTGTDDLGFYDFWSGVYKEEYILSKHAVVSYYVVDPSLEARISGFFAQYDQARNFAEKLFASSHGEVKAFFLVPVTVRSCIRRLKHPIGIFAYVPTMTGSIHASELLFEFRSLLMSATKEQIRRR